MRRLRKTPVAENVVDRLFSRTTCVIAQPKHVWCMNYTIRGGGATAPLLRLTWMVPKYLI